MMTRTNPFSLSTLVLGAAALVPVLSGCSQPPDTSPEVTITVPTAGQVLPAGQQIDVRFTVGGIDPSDPTMSMFKLTGNSTMMVGEGQVRAYLSTGSFVARTVSIPNDANRFLIPDPQYYDPKVLVTPGPKTITLDLFYNGTDQEVSPQRKGTVNIMIQ
jgi:hypothetical protein